MKILAIFNKTKFGVSRKLKPCRSLWGEYSGMPIINIELVGNPNSCIIKILKQKVRALLDSWAEVSLIHTEVYKA